MAVPQVRNRALADVRGGERGGAPVKAQAPAKGRSGAAVRAVTVIVLLVAAAGAAGWFFRTPLLRLTARIPGLQRLAPAPAASGPATGARAADPLAAELAAQAAELAVQADDLAVRTAEMDALAAQLSQQEAEVATLAADLQAREEALAEREAAVAQQEAALADASRRRSQALAMYSNMKAREIAAAFAAMTDDEALVILVELDPALSARVVALMDPARTARLTQRLMAEAPLLP